MWHVTLGKVGIHDRTHTQGDATPGQRDFPAVALENALKEFQVLAGGRLAGVQMVQSQEDMGLSLAVS